MHSTNRFDSCGVDSGARRADSAPTHPVVDLKTARMVAFTGCSMKPTLIEGDLVEVVPYENCEVQVGDIIYYQFPASDEAIIHRVVRITPVGVIARGDNNLCDDTKPILSHYIIGQVVAVWRGTLRRKLEGGRGGMLYYLFHKAIFAFGRTVFLILRPFYQLLVRWEVLARFLPQRFRPKVVKFNDGKETHLRLVWGKRVIGSYDFHRRRWRIYRPFRLLFSEKAFYSNDPLQCGTISTFTHPSHCNN